MNAEYKTAYAGRKRIGKMSIVKFNVNSSYEIPLSLLTADVNQFEVALNFSARLIDLQKSLSDDFVKSTVYEDYMKTIENNHSEELSQVEKSASEKFGSRLSEIIQTITDKQQLFNLQIEAVRNDSDAQIKALAKEKKKIEDAATATKIEIEASLQKEIHLLRKQLAEKDIEVQSLSKGDNLIREHCNSESQKLVTMIEEKNYQTLDALRKSYEQAISLKEDALQLLTRNYAVIREQCNSESQKLLKIVEEKNCAAQESLRKSYEQAIVLKEEVLQQREDKISQREQELHTTLQRGASSSYRGQDGETFFQTLAEEKMKWKLTDTSKIPHSCDYSATIHKINVFFEMKNYTSDVRSDEVTKFLRDMKEHPEVHIGIFISLHTKIAGKDRNKPISIEWINDSQCAVYIQVFKELDEDHTMSLIDQIIKLSSTYNKIIGSKGDMSEETVLQGRIDKARVYIDEYITENCSLIKRVTNDQKLHRQLVESSYSHTVAILKSQSSAINRALEILTGEYKEDNTIDETLIDPVDEVKPKRVFKKKN